LQPAGSARITHSQVEGLTRKGGPFAVSGNCWSADETFQGHGLKGSVRDLFRKRAIGPQGRKRDRAPIAKASWLADSEESQGCGCSRRHLRQKRYRGVEQSGSSSGS
tara:strand:- start:326 stop:646 length:321 start_codon:yes stop_codon:yes gene_type:complete